MQQTICDHEPCRQAVARHADQIHVEVISPDSSDTLEYHAECWQQIGVILPAPGVTVRISRPRLHAAVGAPLTLVQDPAAAEQSMPPEEYAALMRS